MRMIFRLGGLIAFYAMAFPAHAETRQPAPLHLAERAGYAPIRDAAGRIYYIVDLTADAHEGFDDVVAAETSQRFHPRHSAKAQNMVAAYERHYGFEHTHMTSWVGNSFSAYLTQRQVDELRADPRVVRITEVTPIRFSAPLWSDTKYPSSQYPYYERSSWGRNAVNGNVSNGTRRVHVIDGGVGYHEDLPNVVARVNASCDRPNNPSGNCPGKPVVGCYPHATHVAGIIGAPYGNKGVAGVDAGVPMVSVSMLEFPNSLPDGSICSDPAGGFSNTPTVANAMDYVKWDLYLNGGPRAGIVNVSINGADFKPGMSLNEKMLSLATPSTTGLVYYGAFVAQSAGNGLVDACEGGEEGQFAAFGYSDRTPRTTDGIMVVGAIADTGLPVMRDNGGFDNESVTGNPVVEPGSNYGKCVEVWAPGQGILSTWGPIPYSATNSSGWQSQGQTYANYAPLSGTSLAAPHIAGVAAYLAETQGLNSPGEIETAVRKLFYTTGQIDQGQFKNGGTPDQFLVVNLVKLSATASAFSDGSFEHPQLAPGSYVAASGPQIAGSSWYFNGTTGQRGISTNGSAFTAQTVPTADGNQVAFIQGDGVLIQTINTPSSGKYVISLRAIQRKENQNPNGITLSIEVDGVKRWLGTPDNLSYTTYSTAGIQLGAGNHTIVIRGKNALTQDDNTVFIDSVKVKLKIR